MIGGLMYGDRFFSDKLGMIMALSYQSRTRMTESTFFKDLMTQTETNVRLTNHTERTYSEEYSQYGGHLKFDYRFNTKNKLEWCNSYIGSNSYQVREGTSTNLSLNYDPATGNAIQNIQTRSRTTIQNIIASTLHGEHKLTKLLSLDWSAVASVANNERPDIIYVDLDNYSQDLSELITADGSERRWEENTDRDLAGYVNLKYNRKFKHSDLELKAGGMYRDKERTNKFSSYRFSPDS